MWPVTVELLILLLLVFFVGMISARSVSRSRKAAKTKAPIIGELKSGARATQTGPNADLVNQGARNMAAFGVSPESVSSANKTREKMASTGA